MPDRPRAEVKALLHLFQISSLQFVPLSLANTLAYWMLGIVALFLLAGPLISFYYYRQRKKSDSNTKAATA